MAAPTSKASTHRWSFYRAGGVDQVRLDTGADILNLDQLDQKLWVALSCPTKGLELDPRTLELLDSDGDGTVRPNEILAAVRWLRDVLKNADGLAKGEDGVALANLRTDTAEGKALLASCKHILKSLGKESATTITVADASQMAEVFAKAKHNGDGVVAPEDVPDAKARAVAAAIVGCLGGVTDRSGKPGFDQAKLDAFYAACAEFVAWQKAASDDAEHVLPFGDGTAAAFAAYQAVRAKVDDYFARCRLAAFDPRAQAAMNREEAGYLAAAAKELDLAATELAGYPLALVAPDQPLPLQKGLNPAWVGALATFQAHCAKGKDRLTETEWQALGARFAGYAAWLGAKAGAAVESLGLARVQEILAGNERQALQQAVGADLAVADEVAAMARVEKLCRLHRDFAQLLHNYVNFADFYARKGAIFQAGTLYLDRRTCELCFPVQDAGKHATLAPMSHAYLAYVDCTRPGEPKLQVACAFTAGDSDFLFVGRNGVFYDRKGRDWNATITKIVDNPISVRQAFWSPYKKLMRWIEQQVNKRAAEADAASTGKLQETAAKTSEAAAAGSPAAAAAAPKKMDIGVVAAIGVAIGGIATVVSKLLETFFGLGYLMPLGVLAILLLISGPAMLIAWMKLRQRNLGPILDANGWAVNVLTKVNIPLGGSLTEMPHLPAGAHRSLVDPYAEKRSPWPKVVFVLLVLGGTGYGLYRQNLLHDWTHGYVPRHHAVVDLSADKNTAKAGETVTFTVRSAATSLAVTELSAVPPKQWEPLAVDPTTKLAVLVIPKEMKAGSLAVTDTVTGDRLRIAVTE